MNNFTLHLGVDENKLIPLTIQNTLNGSEGTFQFTSGVQDAVAENITPDNTQEATQEINYRKLQEEHAELLSQGKTSAEIVQWIGEKLNIPSWKTGEFHGERKVLSSPKTPEESVRLQKFLEALGASWAKANGGSDNHLQYLLLDGYVQNTLFGSANMAQVDTRLNTFHTDWQKMGNDYITKATYLLEKIGLDIKSDWSKLTGFRNADGDFGNSVELCASGSLGGGDVRRLWLRRGGSFVSFGDASNARLCFLA